MTTQTLVEPFCVTMTCMHGGHGLSDGEGWGVASVFVFIVVVVVIIVVATKACVDNDVDAGVTGQPGGEAHTQ